MVEIYDLSDPGTWEVLYVGRSDDAVKRLWEHVGEAARGMKGAKFDWLRTLRNKGQTPIVRILAVVKACDAPFVEQKWIAQRKSEGCRLLNSRNEVARQFASHRRTIGDVVGQMSMSEEMYRVQKKRWEENNDYCEEFRHREGVRNRSPRAGIRCYPFVRQNEDGTWPDATMIDQDEYYNQFFAEMTEHWRKGEEHLIGAAWKYARSYRAQIGDYGNVHADVGDFSGPFGIEDRPIRWRGKPWTYEEQDALWDCTNPENLPHCRLWQMPPYLEEVVI